MKVVPAPWPAEDGSDNPGSGRARACDQLGQTRRALERGRHVRRSLHLKRSRDRAELDGAGRRAPHQARRIGPL